MADQLQIRGGDTASNATFTGAQRELSVDTSKNQLIVHDGVTPGGHPIPSSDNPEFTGEAEFKGNVGIGTDSPQAKLDIRTSAGTPCQIFLNEATSANSFKIEQTSTEARIQTSATQPIVIASQSGSGTTSDIRFETRDTERVRISAGGNLGIGTDSPSTLLDLRSDNSVIQINTQRDGSNYRNSTLLFGSPRDNSADGNFHGGRGKLSCLGNSENAGSIVWLMAASASLSGDDTDAVNKTKQCGLRLDSAGNIEHWADDNLVYTARGNGKVGIGTDSPDGCLEIASFPSTGTGVPSLYLSRAPSVNSTSDIALKSNAVIRSESSIRNVVNTGGSFTWWVGGTDNKLGITGATEVVRIDSDGSLGIGVNNPQAKLDVDGDIKASNITAFKTRMASAVASAGDLSALKQAILDAISDL